MLNNLQRLICYKAQKTNQLLYKLLKTGHSSKVHTICLLSNNLLKLMSSSYLLQFICTVIITSKIRILIQINQCIIIIHNLKTSDRNNCFIIYVTCDL